MEFVDDTFFHKIPLLDLPLQDWKEVNVADCILCA